MQFSASRAAILVAAALGLSACEKPAPTIVCWEEPVPQAGPGYGGVSGGSIYGDKYVPQPAMRTVCAPVPTRLPGKPHVVGGGGGGAPVAGVPGTPPSRASEGPKIATTLDSNAIAIDGKDYALTEGTGPDRTTIASSGGRTAELEEMTDRIVEETETDLASFGLK